MRLYLSTGLLALLPSFAFAQWEVRSCPTTDGIERTGDLTVVPEPVADSLKEHVPNLTPPGSPFNGGDALLPGQTRLDRRLIAAFHRGNRWVIAYEAAGIGYHHIVVAYDLSADGNTAAIAFKAQAFPESLCNTVDSALSSSGRIDRYW
jgi:hypothetical protein